MLNRQIPVRSHHPVQRPPKYMTVSPDSAAHPAHKITKPKFSEPPCAAAPAVSSTTDSGSGKPHDPSSRITAVVAYPWCSTTASQSIVRVPWAFYTPLDARAIGFDCSLKNRPDPSKFNP